MAAASFRAKRDVGLRKSSGWARTSSSGQQLPLRMPVSSQSISFVALCAWSGLGSLGLEPWTDSPPQLLLVFPSWPKKPGSSIDWAFQWKIDLGTCISIELRNILQSSFSDSLRPRKLLVLLASRLLVITPHLLRNPSEERASIITYVSARTLPFWVRSGGVSWVVLPLSSEFSEVSLAFLGSSPELGLCRQD